MLPAAVVLRRMRHSGGGSSRQRAAVPAAKAGGRLQLALLQCTLSFSCQSSGPAHQRCRQHRPQAPAARPASRRAALPPAPSPSAALSSANSRGGARGVHHAAVPSGLEPLQTAVHAVGPHT